MEKGRTSEMAFHVPLWFWSMLTWMGLTVTADLNFTFCVSGRGLLNKAGHWISYTQSFLDSYWREVDLGWSHECTEVSVVQIGQRDPEKLPCSQRYLNHLAAILSTRLNFAISPYFPLYWKWKEKRRLVILHQKVFWQVTAGSIFYLSLLLKKRTSSILRTIWKACNHWFVMDYVFPNLLSVWSPILSIQ